MAIGGYNAWFNFSYSSRINTPNDCLLNPEGSRLILLETCKKSPQNNIKIFIHTFYTTHLREPAAFKSTSKIIVEEAWKEWHDLQEMVWTEVSHNFG